MTRYTAESFKVSVHKKYVTAWLSKHDWREVTGVHDDRKFICPRKGTYHTVEEATEIQMIREPANP